MAPLGSTNYQAILAQANQQVQQLLTLVNTDSSSVGSFSASNINCVFDLAQNVGQMTEGDDSQKTYALQNILGNITSLLSNLGTKDSANANKRVKNSDKQITSNDNQAAATAQSVDAQLQNILDQCNVNKGAIENALAKIQALGGDEGQIKKAQSELEQQLEIIEDSKRTLNNPESQPEDRKNALKAILNAVTIINGLVETVNKCQEEIEAQNAVIETSSNNLAELSTNATEVLTTGINDIKTNLQNSKTLTTDNTVMSADALQEDVVGTTQVSIGEAMTSSPAAIVTGAEGAQYIMSGNDKINAGSTLMQGAVTNLSKLTQSVGAFNGYLTEFTNFANGIGQFTDGTAELVGQYDTTVNPMITAIGSWQNIADANQKLEQYTNDYAAEVGLSDQDIMESAGFAAANSFMNSQTTAWTRGITAQPEHEENESQEIIYKEFSFDTSVFKIKE